MYGRIVFSNAIWYNDKLRYTKSFAEYWLYMQSKVNQYPPILQMFCVIMQ